MVCLKKWLTSEILQYVLCYFQLSKILLLSEYCMFNYVTKFGKFFIKLLLEVQVTMLEMPQF